MAAERLEPFRQALLDLRRRLREGELEPGARVTAREVAEALRLSPTPVREALCRLAGEGLLEERRGEGFFVTRPAAVELADLYRLSAWLLELAQAPGRAPHRDLTGVYQPPGQGGPVETVEGLFRVWAAEAASRVVSDLQRAVALRLAAARRREPQLFADLAEEAAALVALAGAAGRPARVSAIRAFHARRVAAADALARLLEPEAASDRI